MVYQPVFPIQNGFPINLALLQRIENMGDIDEESSYIQDSQSEEQNFDDYQDEALDQSSSSSFDRGIESP